MERLSFAEAGTYSGLEASIHIARYALARGVCRGRKVLDLACGEGYGSRLMLDWGATEVVGVDVSEDAIANARKRFGRDGLRYLSGDAEKVEELLAGEQFDLIISLETIEHLHNPAAYLKALTQLRAPNGEILISCPNDWWYYPSTAQSNPYHIRKYTYEDFITLVRDSLGEPDSIALGLPIAGFINVPIQDVPSADTQLSQMAMISPIESRNALVVPIEPGSVAPSNSSYFVARWGRDGQGISGAGILPVPMDVFRNGLYSSDLSAMHDALQDTVRNLQSELEAADRNRVVRDIEIADLKLNLQSERVRLAAINVENEVIARNASSLLDENVRLEGENARLKGENAVAEIAARRYWRMRGMIPEPVVSVVRRIYMAVLGRK